MSGNGDKWFVARYRPTALFSLRTTYSTSSGGKTLLVPTPYAVRLAFVDASYRAEGEALARRVFELLLGRRIRFRPPEHAAVTHTFIKIKREARDAGPEEPYISSIAFREFCHFQGELCIAIAAEGLAEADLAELTRVAAHINYFGKRGSFFAFAGAETADNLPAGFSLLVPDDLMEAGQGYATAQFLDELAPELPRDIFDRINSYSDRPLSLGKHRIIQQHLLPYRTARTSKSYTHYKWAL
ncbi:MAG: hypothetical protein ACM3XS_08795 [Bacteroidota bacterium]